MESYPSTPKVALLVHLRLRDLYSEIIQMRADELEKGGDMRQEVTPGWSTRDADSLRTACGHEGFPVCTLVLETVQRYMDTWQYEGFSDVEHRHKLIQTRGLLPAQYMATDAVG